MTTRVQARYRSATGELGAVRDVSTLGVPATDPRVAMLPGGSALLVWRGWDGSYYRIQSRTLSPAGVLGPIKLISPAGRDAYDPQLVVNPAGDALVAWRARGRIQVRMRAGNGTFAATQTLSPGAPRGGGCCSSPVAAIDADGDAVIVWETSGSSSSPIAGVRRAADGTLGPPQALGTGDFPQVAIDPEGDAMVTWSAAGNMLLGRAWSAGDTLAGEQAIGALFFSNRDHRVEMDAAGNALVVWEKSSLQIVARSRSAAGVLGPEEPVVSDPEGVRDPEVDADAAGNVEIVWARKISDSRTDIEARERLADGTLTPVQRIGARRAGPSDVAVEPGGTALAAFNRVRSLKGDRVQISAGP